MRSRSVLRDYLKGLKVLKVLKVLKISSFDNAWAGRAGELLFVGVVGGRVIKG